MMAMLPNIPVRPPGLQRPYPKPDTSGKLAFKSANAGIEGETAYWVWGDLSSGKRPLIALHGGPGVTHGYMVPISLLQNDYGIPVIMYDQIGCGASTRFRHTKGDSKVWTRELFVEELDNIVKWLEQEWKITQYDVLGHSWGGKLGALYAIRMQPAGLGKLVVCNSSTNTNSIIVSRTELRKKMPAEIQDIMRRQDAGEEVDANDARQAMMFEQGLHTCRFQPYPEELMSAFNALREDDTVFGTMSGFVAGGALRNTPDPIDSDLPQITRETCPGGILVVGGQHDTSHDGTMTKWFTDPKCEVKWVRFALSSHFVMWEEPEPFLKIIGSFLTHI